MSKILYLEDNDLCYELVGHLIKDIGHDLIRACDGPEGLALYQNSNDISLILTNIMLPKMDGLEVTKRIRRIDPEIPVVAVTATVTSESRKLCSEAGFNDFIPKPIKANLFCGEILKYLDSGLYNHFFSLYKMKELRTPTEDEFDGLTEAVTLSPEEKAYWDGMEERRDSQLDEKDFRGRTSFHQQELKLVNEMFGERVAVERRLKYGVGLAYELLGTHGLKCCEPIERANMLEKAVLWYQSADETTGFLTDYSLRQSLACTKAADFRKKAGLEDEITEKFSKRADQLMSAFFGPNTRIIRMGVSDDSYFVNIRAES